MELLFLIPAVGWLIIANWLHRILGFPFGRARLKRMGRGVVVPDELADLYECAHEQLAALGFDGPRLAELEADWPEETVTHLQSAWWHPDDGVAVYLLPPENPQDPDRLNVIFLSRTADGRLWLSQPFDPYLAAATRDDEYIMARVIGGEDLAEQFASHRDWVAQQPARVDRRLLAGASVDSMLANIINRLRRSLLDGGMLSTGRDGISRPRLRFGLRLLVMLLRRPAPPPSNAPVPDGRLHHFARIEERTRALAPLRFHQWLLFSGSVAAFVLLGSAIFGWWFALALAVVIVLHESGHYLAMRVFGYRQVRMMLLPLVGGVTIGHEQSPDPVRRGWVSLMGPLPGIVLGASLLYWLQAAEVAPELHGVLILFAWLLLIVNYLNLLPVPPLDGGRIVEDLLPARWVWLRVLAVATLCGVGMMAALWFGTWLLALVVALPLLSLRGVITSARAARHIDGPALRPLDEKLRRQRVFEALESISGQAREVPGRLVEAEAARRLVRFEPVGRGRQLALAATFCLVLLAPLGTTLAATLMWYGLGFNAGPEAARIDRIWEQTREELESLSTRELVTRFGPDPGMARGAEKAQLAAAERRVGRALPPFLKRLYRISDGLPQQGLWPLARLTAAPECLAGLLQEYERLKRQEGIDPLRTFDQGRELSIQPQVLKGWLCIGDDGDSSLWVVASPDATLPEDMTSRFMLFSDYGVEVHDSFENWLRNRFIVERAGQRQRVLLDERRQALLEEMHSQSVVQLLDRMPQPGWLERRALDLPGLPGPASTPGIDAVEARLGRPLPPSLSALYSRHDGYAPWRISPVERLRYLENRMGNGDSWMSEFKAPLVFDGPEGDDELQLDATDLSGCLVVGETPGLSSRNGGAPAVLWCPQLEAGKREVLDLRRRRYFQSLERYFQFATAERLLFADS